MERGGGGGLYVRESPGGVHGREREHCWLLVDDRQTSVRLIIEQVQNHLASARGLKQTDDSPTSSKLTVIRIQPKVQNHLQQTGEFAGMVE